MDNAPRRDLFVRPSFVPESSTTTERGAVMPYAEGRVYHDADSHVMETPGWIIAHAGGEICLFSSDWPHVEGGRNPIKRFEDSVHGASERARQRFYCDNFVDLMGAGMP
jgi:hypothetical protein